MNYLDALKFRPSVHTFYALPPAEHNFCLVKLEAISHSPGIGLGELSALGMTLCKSSD
jgi:hypothetical protein